MQCSQLSPYLVIGPLNAAVALAICWQYVGWTCLVGLAVLLGFIPLNSLMGRLFLRLRTRVAKLTDRRLRLMAETVRGMRVIKMYGWEFHFHRLVAQQRRYACGQESHD